ncbi:MAG: NAD(P)/FAD-dependent oxidoreductase [Bacteroidota bacterium]
MFDVIVVGGGAAGFFGAIQTALANPSLKIAIFERGKTVLGKVKISGGGRCNVAHAAFEPLPLTANYPRGQKELLGPFHNYASGDIMGFFEERGVVLKIEQDGRIFPETDSSQTIIDCFLNETKKYGITILKNSAVKALEASTAAPGGWRITTMNKHYHTKKLLLATGSNPKIWQLLAHMGHKVVPPVPSLFTFNCKDERIKGLQGISVMNAVVDIMPKTHYNPKIVVKLESKITREPLYSEEGPLLITHWGLSGPAVLKLSAWAARTLEEFHYTFRIRINWVPEYDSGTMIGLLQEVKAAEPRKTVYKSKVVPLPGRLWGNLVKATSIAPALKWGDMTKVQLQNLAKELTECSLKIEGKSTYKEEFVTAGGVDLKEVNFKTYESKLFPNLFFAGEIMNVDAVTGGFNFQNAWTGAFIAAQTMAKIP